MPVSSAPTDARRDAPTPTRERRDRCPGVLRPWVADDGALVRVRLVGGRIGAPALVALSEVAVRHGDGDLHLTSRANLQLRGLPSHDGLLVDAVVEEVEAAGLLPSRAHDLARNVMVSPLTGLLGGRADLRPVADELDHLLRSVPTLAALPGRFLQVLDDGRGDLVDLTGLVRRGPDLGLVALDADTAQLRHGRDGWGEVVPLAQAASALVALAARFCGVRGEGPEAPWHVDELPEPLAPSLPRDPRTHVHTPPPAYGGAHVAAPDGVLSPRLVAELADRGHDLVVTPWRGVLVAGDVAREASEESRP